MSAQTPSGACRVEVVVIASAAVTAAVGVLGALLAGVGWWLPGLVWPLVALMVLLAVVAARRAMARQPRQDVPWALLVVVLILTTWYAATAAEQVLPRRDAGSNLQAAIALSTGGSRVIRVDPSELGGAAVLAVPGVTLESPGFYQVSGPSGPAIEPQFVVGVASILSLGWWAGGTTGATLLAALAVSLALLGIGAAIGRLRGPIWGAVAAAVLGIAYPMAYVARSTFSEPFALLLLVAGALSMELALRESSRRLGVWAGALAGALIASGVLVRIDTLRELALFSLVLGMAGVLDRARRTVALATLAAMTVVGGLAYLANRWHSPRYLALIESSVTPALGFWLGALLAGPLLGLALRWAIARGQRVQAAIPLLASGLTALVLVLLASRPLWLVARQGPQAFGTAYVASMQAAEGLSVDGARTYAENTIGWLTWALGLPAVAVAAVVAVLAVGRLVRTWLERDDAIPPGLIILVVALGSSVFTLWRPGITPDHPWADRRLIIPIVLVVVLAVLGASALARGTTPVVVVRILVASFIGCALWGVATMIPGRVETGSAEAVQQVCAQLAPGDVVIAADDRAANEWPQVIRGTCGHPALALTEPTRNDPTARSAAMAALREAVARGGHRAVFLSTQGPGEPAVRVVTRQHPNTLTKPPRGTIRLAFEVWLSP